MIDVIVFSRNRPMQLYAMLESLHANFGGLGKVSVLFRTDDERYEMSYLAMPFDVHLEWQIDFIGDFRRLVEKSGEYVALFVDDDIVFRPVIAKKIDEAMSDDVDIVSLRLGGNIRNKKHFFVKGSLDGNVYRRDQLLQALPEKCQNPNKLEIAVCRAMIDKSMAWFSLPSVIGVPANRVSETSGCDFRGQTVEELQALYEQGHRIDWRKMELKCHDVHKKEPYAFRME